MSNTADTEALRAQAREHIAGGRTLSAQVLIDAADTIDTLRAACASLGPPPSMRLMHHRANATAFIAAMCAVDRWSPVDAKGRAVKHSDVTVAQGIEALAHAMLAAEREVAP